MTSQEKLDSIAADEDAVLSLAFLRRQRLPSAGSTYDSDRSSLTSAVRHYLAWAKHRMSSRARDRPQSVPFI